MDKFRIAFLHLAPRACEIGHNQALIENSIAVAAKAGAKWILTPELATSGYTFSDCIGTDWMAVQPDSWVHRICGLARYHRAVIFLAHVERDQTTNALHNSLFVIADTGQLTGRHRKINVLRVGSEAWATPGDEATVVDLDRYGKVGLLICADAYSPAIAERLKERDARFLVSSAAWAPGLHGPDGEWERISRDTGLPLFVCNRTGEDKVVDFTDAETVVVHGGERLMSLTSDESVVFVVDWHVGTGTLRSLRRLHLDA